MESIPLAHTRQGSGEAGVQTLQEHSRHVAEICAALSGRIGLRNLGYLTGLLHDAGKAHPKWQTHLRENTSEKPGHAYAGMLWLWENRTGGGDSQNLAAQFATLAIGCHHSGRCDMISPDGIDCFRERMAAAHADSMYMESMNHFFAHCCTKAEVYALLESAAEELRALCGRVAAAFPLQGEDRQANKRYANSVRFAMGLVQRFLFSALVDADWTDTACFMQNRPLPKEPDDIQRQGTWDKLSEHTEQFVTALPALYPIDRLRRDISERCMRAAERCGEGVYRLCVPTGGGKTYAGLRFCMQMAKKHNAQHVFYFSPYKSITGQNAACIRQALGSVDAVLEHHSDVLAPEENTESERFLAQSQRWQEVPVICTTMVQFLNTLFAAPRQNVRRLCALSNSVLLFDEIQVLPLQHTYLFNLAVMTLSELLHCTVVLCTATQPTLERAAYPLRFSEPVDLVENSKDLFLPFCRTRLIPKLIPGGMHAPQLADFICAQARNNRSILIVLNTKKAVNSLFDALQGQTPADTKLFCLTTYLCSQHRRDVLTQISKALRSGERLICVSTQLIEAGVDLSFDCVVRSLAGLPNIAQAAGRCNRHGQGGVRDVYLVVCADEDLRHLPEIDDARRITRDLLDTCDPNTDLLSPQMMDAYFRQYYENAAQSNKAAYPAPGRDLPQNTTLLDLLSSNTCGVRAFVESGHKRPGTWSLCQAFGTAERLFEAIADAAVPVLVPYKEGVRKIAELFSLSPDKVRLSDLQPYTVSLGKRDVDRLEQAGAVYPALQGAVRVLREEFYDSEKIGVRIQAEAVPPCFV